MSDDKQLGYRPFHLSWHIRELKQYDDDEDNFKNNRFNDQNNSSTRVHHAFQYISLTSTARLRR